MASQTISHYELLARIGSGGMGSVWRARDLRGGNIVAVKLLHEHLSTNREYVQRFQREARIARSIDSARVVKVLDSGQHGDRFFLVMEYVAGRTLADVLRAEGRLSIERSVAIAAAIAEALQAAHEKNVVHRDISPQNVIIQPDGTVKVTDFGVARDLGATAMTATSMLLGKPQYIAPEVVTGQSAADIRTDIYALGVVLYQMLTGAVPFNAETPYAAMQMQATRTPPPLSGIRGDVPPCLINVVGRCLAKEQRDRFQTPGALAGALRSRGGEAETTRQIQWSARGVSEPSRPSEAERPTQPSANPIERSALGVTVQSVPGSRFRLALAAGFFGLGVVVVVLWVVLANGARDTARIAFTSERDGSYEIFVMPLDGSKVTRLTNSKEAVFARVSSWSPDGTRIAFTVSTSGKGQIYVMNADGTGQTRLTTNTSSDGQPEWSPDGTRIVFVSDRDGNREVYVMNADGSGHTRLTDSPEDESNPAWSPDASRIAYASTADGQAEIYVMNADGTGQMRLTDSPEDEFNPAWSPDGSRIAFVSNRDDNYYVYVMNADGSAQVRLTDRTRLELDPAWSRDGTQIAFASGSNVSDTAVYVINLDGSGLRYKTSGRAPAWSPDGRFITYSARNQAIYTMTPDGSGVRSVTENPWNDRAPAFSPDGTRMAFASDRDGDYEIYVMNSDGTDQMRLTNSQGEDDLPVWSPDGTRIAFTSNRDGDYEIYVMNADGTGQGRLTDSPGTDWGPAWSPDGRRIAFTSYRDEDDELYVMNADGTGQTRLTHNVGPDWYPAWSLDGTPIAFSSYRDEGEGIYVMNGDGTEQTRLTADFDSEPAWSPDGSRITFSSFRDLDDEIYVMNADGTEQARLTDSPGPDLKPVWSR